MLEMPVLTWLVAELLQLQFPDPANLLSSTFPQGRDSVYLSPWDH